MSSFNCRHTGLMLQFALLGACSAKALAASSLPSLWGALPSAIGWDAAPVKLLEESFIDSDGAKLYSSLKACGWNDTASAVYQSSMPMPLIIASVISSTDGSQVDGGERFQHKTLELDSAITTTAQALILDGMVAEDVPQNQPIELQASRLDRLLLHGCTDSVPGSKRPCWRGIAAPTFYQGSSEDAHLVERKLRPVTFSFAAPMAKGQTARLPASESLPSALVTSLGAFRF